jgi:Zn ribbon nucleic-acid-binding protein
MKNSPSPIGIVGASNHLEMGGSAEYACLTREPQYAKYTAALEGWAKIYGVEYEVGASTMFDRSKAPAGTVQNADVVCAVCRSKARLSQVRHDHYVRHSLIVHQQCISCGFRDREISNQSNCRLIPWPAYKSLPISGLFLYF